MTNVGIFGLMQDKYLKPHLQRRLYPILRFVSGILRRTSAYTQAYSSSVTMVAMALIRFLTDCGHKQAIIEFEIWYQ